MLFGFILSCFFFLDMASHHFNMVDSDDITIVMIEGKAFLAEVDDKGVVLHKYMEVKDFDERGDDLKNQIERAKQNYLEIKEREKDQIRFLQYDYVDGEVRGLANAHLDDLVTHYNNTYANQIVITFGKRPGNEDLLKEKERLLIAALEERHVPKENIKVLYKWDRGPEPTQFIKIKTGLRDLVQL